MIHILGRFHIAAKRNVALDQMCAVEVRSLARDGYESVLQKTRWCLLKRRAPLARMADPGAHERASPVVDPIGYARPIHVTPRGGRRQAP